MYIYIRKDKSYTVTTYYNWLNTPGVKQKQNKPVTEKNEKVWNKARNKTNISTYSGFVWDGCSAFYSKIGLSNLLLDETYSSCICMKNLKFNSWIPRRTSRRNNCKERQPGHLLLKMLFSKNRFFCIIVKVEGILNLIDCFFLLVYLLLLQLLLSELSTE